MIVDVLTILGLCAACVWVVLEAGWWIDASEGNLKRGRRDD